MIGTLTKKEWNLFERIDLDPSKVRWGHGKITERRTPTIALIVAIPIPSRTFALVITPEAIGWTVV